MEVLWLRKCSAIDFLGEPCFRWLKFTGIHLLQYKAERLGWSGSLLLQTEAALIADYSRKQIHYRYVLYMTPLQKTPTIPLKLLVGVVLHFILSQTSCFPLQPPESTHRHYTDINHPLALSGRQQRNAFLIMLNHSFKFIFPLTFSLCAFHQFNHIFDKNAAE